MKNERLFALDAFRGLTIALMILVNTPGSWAYVYSPLRHAKWHGCTLTDLVFPFFLFIVGVAMRFSLKQFGFTLTADAGRKIIGRTLTIFVIGLLLNAFPFIRQNWDWSHFRIMGVLQRIALAYGIAAFLILISNKKRLLIEVFCLLSGYWFLLWIFGGADPYGLESNFALTFDRAILGENHLWTGNGIPFDPEGLFSTIPAIATVLIGYHFGTMLQKSSYYKNTIKMMFLQGVSLMISGWIWSFFFPLNKQLWTSSYVLFTAGLASLVLSVFVWLIDIHGWKKFAFPLVVFGTNSIFIFASSALWVKTILRTNFTLNGEAISGYAYLFKTIFQPLAGDMNGSLLFALFHVFIWWLILYWLYHKKIFIKI